MSRFHKALAPAVLAASLPLAAGAQVPGALDTNFGTGGVTVVDVTVNGDPRANSASGLALQSDGKVVMSGSASLIGAATGPERMIAVRLLANGGIDNSFGSSGRVRIDALPQGNEGYYDGRLAIAPSGAIYLFNGTQDAGGVIGWALARVGTGGALDGTFGSGGIVTAAGNTLEAGDVAVNSAGRALVYEDFFDTTPNPNNQDTAVGLRLADGDPDPAFGLNGFRVISFDLGTLRHDFARVLYVQRDGKILAAGHAELTATNWNFAIARLTPEGDLDPTFGGGDGLVTFSFDLAIGNLDEVRALAVDARGRIYAGGLAGTFSGNANECALARLLPDGTLDTSFSGDGKVTFPFASPVATGFDQIFGLALQGNNRIVAVGRGTNAGGSGRTAGIARLTEDGVLDPTFSGDGTTVYAFQSGGGNATVGRAVSLASDGRIVLSGFTQQTSGDNDFFAARLHNDYIFADGFETGDDSAWSSTAP